MRAVVIGDAMVDAYMWGKIERVSPEAPIPKIVRARVFNEAYSVLYSGKFDMKNTGKNENSV